ncbi:hemolysin family protein [Aestuariibius insulae]|uniref:hemolysin family protein n=1 Tax=Aestuariibius insulae TaxID=2058287 RepID=UPI00345E5935
MNDTADGSSGAAQSAQDDQEQTNRGFLGRVKDIFSPSATPAPNQDIPAATPTTVPGMLNLRRMRVEDVAVPKSDIVAVPVTATMEEILEVFRDSGLTRIPVFEGTLDKPVGFAHLKDFALKHGFNGKVKNFDLNALVRPLLFVPPSMQIGVLLTKMQADRIHMALVIDEYGGTDGLVTIEDLIEQVIGEIEDEHDIAEGQNWSLEGPGCYMAKAKTPLDEFRDEIGLDLTATEEIDEEEVDTLGGLVFMLSGHVPARGEVIPHPAGPEFEVVDADPRRIKRLRVRLKEAPKDE